MSPQDVLPYASAAAGKQAQAIAEGKPQLPLRWDREGYREWLVPETWIYYRPLREVVAKVICESQGRWFFITSNGATSNYFPDLAPAQQACERYCAAHPELGAFP